jgi:hypothetical protein
MNLDICRHKRGIFSRASIAYSVCGPAKSISHIQVLVIYSFATPPIRLKLGQQIGGRLLITNHLEQITMIAQSENQSRRE